jgi:hypothetical protein
MFLFENYVIYKERFADLWIVYIDRRPSINLTQEKRPKKYSPKTYRILNASLPFGRLFVIIIPVLLMAAFSHT